MKRKLVLFFLMCVFINTAVYAADTRPSQESIKELIAASDVKKLTDDMIGQVEAIMEMVVQQLAEGEQGRQELSPGEQKIIDDTKNKMVGALKQEMKWENLEPYYIQIYQETFTQDEVNGIIAFYKTPAGQAAVKKMPVLAQKATLETQARMLRLIGRFEKIQKEALQKMEEQKNKDKVK